MSEPFAGFDLSDFWAESDYANQDYVDNPLTPEKVARVEKELGYRLPGAYVTLMMSQNGGEPNKTSHRSVEATSWARDHVAIAGIYSIGDAKPCSLGGEVGSRFWIEEWGYPPIGIYFADCPSAGHDMICLDYRECGRLGEPTVVHVDQEYDYKITFIAEKFEDFILGLQSDDDFELVEP